MRCIVVDDEPHAIEVLRRYVEKTSNLLLCGTFRDPHQAADFLMTAQIDLIFLDINMPGMTGIQLLKSLREKPLVIFTTAYPHYGAESYDYDAVDYLMKPITFERYLKAVSKAKNLSEHGASIKADEILSLKSGTQIFRVKLSDVMYISKDGNYLVVHTQNRKILLRANMSDAFTMFPPARFCQIHKSFVVAVDHLTVVDSGQVEINKTILPVGSTYREGLMKLIRRS
jgi:two-component system LytT family response regulator